MRIVEMLSFDQETLDYFASILKQDEPWAVQNIYDELEEYGIPDGQEAILFRELLPDLVAWFDKSIVDEHAGYSALSYAIYLIENEHLTALIPFVVKSLNKNKHAVIKNLLLLIKNAEGAGELSKEMLENLLRFNIRWPELEAIRKSFAAR